MLTFSAMISYGRSDPSDDPRIYNKEGKVMKPKMMRCKKGEIFPENGIAQTIMTSQTRFRKGRLLEEKENHRNQSDRGFRRRGD